jgi:hypothetical protein
LGGIQPASKKKPKVEQPALRFKWATFCKGVAVEPGGQETTLIGLMSGIEVGILVPPGMADPDRVTIPLPIWLHAEFELVKEPVKPGKLDLICMLEAGAKPIKETIVIQYMPGPPRLAANVRVVFPNGINLKKRKQTVSATFIHNDQNLGRVTLDVKLTVHSELPKGG